MAKNNLKYNSYELFDFLLDPNFKQWVLNPNKELNDFWQKVIDANPTQYDTIQKAIKIVKNIPSVDQHIYTERRNSLWSKIEDHLDVQPVIRPKKLKLGFIKYAAAIIIILGTVSGIWFYQQKNSMIEIATGNGENKSILLPDGSNVILAANSSISYYKNLSKNGQREIWATGDAKFNVKHINQNPKAIQKGERFIVHLDQKLDVEVLGTIFSISSRRGASSVALLSGSVRVNSPKKAVVLQPGENAISKLNQVLTISKKPLPIVREWEQQTIILNRTSVKQIIELMKDNYGIELKVDNSSILQKELDGVLPLNDLEKALQILTSITVTELQKKDHNYLLKEIK